MPESRASRSVELFIVDIFLAGLPKLSRLEHKEG